MEKRVKTHIQAGWNGWEKASGVICDRRVSAEMKRKVYKTVVRPAMLVGLETVSLSEEKTGGSRDVDADQE